MTGEPWLNEISKQIGEKELGLWCTVGLKCFAHKSCGTLVVVESHGAMHAQCVWTNQQQEIL